MAVGSLILARAGSVVLSRLGVTVSASVSALVSGGCVVDVAAGRSADSATGAFYTASSTSASHVSGCGPRGAMSVAVSMYRGSSICASCVEVT